jgi:hypothetical protein
MKTAITATGFQARYVSLARPASYYHDVHISHAFQFNVNNRLHVSFNIWEGYQLI